MAAASALGWLNDNSGAVTAIVTAVYASFTILLWLATKRQAKITRQIFEVSQRPYLSVKPDWSLDSLRELIARFDLHLQNHGTLPAVIIGWEVTVTLGTRTIVLEKKGRAEIGLCLFPKQADKIGPVELGDEGTDALMQGPEVIRIDSKIEYEDVSKRRYWTRYVCKAIPPNEFETERYEIK